MSPEQARSAFETYCEILTDLEARGLIGSDASFEDVEAVLEKLEQEGDDDVLSN